MPLKLPSESSLLAEIQEFQLKIVCTRIETPDTQAEFASTMKTNIFIPNLKFLPKSEYAIKLTALQADFRNGN